jgi:hypothetical protein
VGCATENGRPIRRRVQPYARMTMLSVVRAKKGWQNARLSFDPTRALGSSRRLECLELRFRLRIIIRAVGTRVAPDHEGPVAEPRAWTPST